MNPLPRFALLDVALELEAVLQERQIGHVSLRSGGFHLGDDTAQLVGLDCRMERPSEVLDAPYRGGRRDTRASRDCFQIAAGGSCGRKAAHREQTFVVEDHMYEVRRPIPR